MAEFKMSSVDQAPQTPGLYAWYVKFQAGSQDWRIRPEGEVDGAIEGFLQLLTRYASYHAPLPIDLQGVGAYGARWRGHVELDRPLQEELDGDELVMDKRLDAIRDTLASEGRRRVMAELLMAATPFFSSPLYIGVAENLRVRLQQHHRDFTDAYDWLLDHPEDAPLVKAKGKSFGQRAAARGISMDTLVAWVLHFDADDADIDAIMNSEIRRTAEAAEWVLHQLYSPILGKN
ncbi:hypothetical protein Mame01_53550 [Microbispora amethystogenes]|nr:hypothetical protein Mame01_53550 [Microbispora amethystogenes]